MTPLVDEILSSYISSHETTLLWKITCGFFYLYCKQCAQSKVVFFFLIDIYFSVNKKKKKLLTTKATYQSTIELLMGLNQNPVKLF